MKDKILGFEPVNERICKLRVKGKYNNISLISVYVLTEDKEEEETELFYHMLEQVCDKTNSHDTLIVLDDFNARIGKESFVNPVVGMYSLHSETSPNGLKLCQLAEELCTEDCKHGIST